MIMFQYSAMVNLIWYHFFSRTSLDPRVRHTVWTFLIGGGILWTSIYGTNQAQAQRMFSLPSVKKAQM